MSIRLHERLHVWHLYSRSGTACVEGSREKSMLGTVQHEYFKKTAGDSIQANVLIVLYFPLPLLHL